MASPTTEEESIREFLKDRPRNAKAMARLSCLLSERVKALPSGKKQDKLAKDAVACAKRSIKLAPNRPMGYAALSVASSSHKERMEALIRAIELHASDDKDATIEETAAYVGSLARLLVEPREEEARTCTATRTAKEHPSRRGLSGTEAALYQRTCDTLEMVWGDNAKTPSVQSYVGQVEFRLGLFFRKMLPSDVHRPRSRNHLVKACENLPASDPFAKKAKFWLATFSSDGAMDDGKSSKYVVGIDRCPEEYVVSLYSSFAAKFDSMLVDKLNYETPSKLRELVDAALEEPGSVWAEYAIDLGCGTGLSGLAFKDCTKHLIGVDLSPEMIEKAEQRNCYDKIVVADVADVFNRPDRDFPPKFDLVFSCDVFVYLGDLSDIFSSVRRVLQDYGGLFAFTTEFLEEEVAEEHPYILQDCARFAHKRSYIEGLAVDTGFEVLMLQISPIRRNRGKDVLGILAVFRNS